MDSQIKLITSNLETLNSFLLESKSTFLIPDFQRDFVWEKEDIKQLLEDFSDDTNHFSVETSELEGYLLGNIVLIDSGKEKIVIDGQQRLTTITLIFKVLEQIISKKVQEYTDRGRMMFWMKKLGGLQSGYAILNDHDSFEKLKIRHDSGLPFGTFYRKLMNDSSGDFIPETKSDQNIYDVYEGITEFLEELNDNELIQFIAYFKTKVMLIVTNSPSHSKAFQLFEVLNDRGRSLEPLDLIKNMFLKTLSIEGFPDNKIDHFNENWKTFINNIQKRSKKNIPSSTFLKHFILGTQGKNIKKEKLFDYFKEANLSGQQILELSNNISDASAVYSDIENKKFETFYQDDNMYIIFTLLKIKQIHALLVPFYKETNERKKIIVDSAARLSASVIFSFTPTNFIEQILPPIISKYNSQNKSDEAFVELINELEGKTMEKAVHAQNSVLVRKFENSNGKTLGKALDLLKFIELYFHNNPLVKNVKRGKKISVEHILSREIQVSSYKEIGFDNEEDFRSHLNKIGNLTLLYNTDNSSLGNEIFINKVPNYNLSDFIITKSIVTNIETTVKNGQDTKLVNLINEYEPTYFTEGKNHFNKGEISKRSADISNLLYNILIHSKK